MRMNLRIREVMFDVAMKLTYVTGRKKKLDVSHTHDDSE